MIEHLPARVRRIVYVSYALVGLIIGGTQVGFSAAGVEEPVALTVALAVFAFVGTTVGLGAYTYTSDARQDTEP